MGHQIHCSVKVYFLFIYICELYIVQKNDVFSFPHVSKHYEDENLNVNIQSVALNLIETLKTSI